MRFDRFKPNRYLLVGSIYLMFLLALVLRLWLVWHNDGYVTDKHIFQNWALKANQLGFQDFYYANMFLDYPPGYVYVLMGIDKLLETWNIGFFVPFASFMFAIPSVLCDLVTGAMVLYIGTKKIDMLHGMFFSASYLFCPAVFVNSAMWQQVDAWPTMFLFISVWFLYEEKYVVSGSLYGLALISKPQMLTFVPVYLYFCLKDRKFRELGKGVGCVVLSILLVALPFTRGLNFLWLVDLYRKTMGSYNFYTLNAYNFWGMFHMNSSELPIDWQKGVLTVVAPAVACAVGALLYFGSKRKDTLFAVPVVLQGITFLFGVKMHERYMFPLYVFSLVCCIVLGSRLLFGLHLSLCTLNYLNVANVLGGELVVLHSMGVRLDVEWWLSVLQVFIFIVMLVVLFVSFIGKESGDVCFSVTAVED
ncbi:MAG: hypothetical protein HDQ88_04355 [Clostridia bacterium]|nr:hypothetical protein [Clostridia bacterium]